MSDAAQILYGGAPAAPAAAAPAPAPTGVRPAAAAPTAAAPTAAHAPTSAPAVAADVAIKSIADAVPKAVREARSAPDRLLYGAAQTEHAESVTAADFAHPNVPPEVSAAIAGEVREMFSDLGFTGAESKAFVAAVKAHDPKTASPDACIDALNAEFGMQAAQAAEAARQMVARDPRLARGMIQNGVGNNPQIALAIARAAMRQRGNLPGRK